MARFSAFRGASLAPIDVPARPGEHRRACPKCAAIKPRRRDDALAVRREPDGSMRWICHRCGWKGGWSPEPPEPHRFKRRYGASRPRLRPPAPPRPRPPAISPENLARSRELYRRAELALASSAAPSSDQSGPEPRSPASRLEAWLEPAPADHRPDWPEPEDDDLGAMTLELELEAPPPVTAAELAAYLPGLADNECAALEVWHGSTPIEGTPAEAYLLGRRIDPNRLPPHAGTRWPAGLRWHAGRSALVVAVNDASTGYVRAVQAIALEHDGTPRRNKDGGKIKLSYGPIKGRAARFSFLPSTDGHLALAEGPETALAAATLLGIPCWSTLGASGLVSLAETRLPAWVRRVTVVADNDPAGRRAAVRAVDRLRAQDLTVSVVAPREPGADAADLLITRSMSSGG